MRKPIGKDRYELINTQYFTGTYVNNEEMWLEVAEYMDKVYEIEKAEKVYISGDGASWIKEGLNWIPKSRFELDYFHLSKYKRTTAHIPHTTNILYDYVRQHNRENVIDLLNVIISATDSMSKRESIYETKRYGIIGGGMHTLGIFCGAEMSQNPGAVQSLPPEGVKGQAVVLAPADLNGEKILQTGFFDQLRQVPGITKNIRKPENRGFRFWTEMIPKESASK